MGNGTIERHLRSLVRKLPAEWRVRLRRWLRQGFGRLDQRMRAAQEAAAFDDVSVVHDLPPIHHYWSNTYLRPLFEQFGFSYPHQFFAAQLLDAYRSCQERPVRFLSIGSGNCDVEVALAADLVASGATDFILECVDLSPIMLERGLAEARVRGVDAQLQTVVADCNHWRPNTSYAAIMANQSLHHVVNLEGLFDAVRTALSANGRFLVSDIIGRNGHRRWPEALTIVQEFWRELPDAYRYNLQLHRQERTFRDWDCSLEGFEGIRAQDILPLLIERFSFELFIAYANVIDPFIDRGFGPHFDSDRAWDRDFIDRVHAADQAAILTGRIKPTHMVAVLCADRTVASTCHRHLTPEFCVRATAIVHR